MSDVLDSKNLDNSFYTILSDVHNRLSRFGKKLLSSKESVIYDIYNRLADGSFQISKDQEAQIKQGGKVRTIQVIPLVDRIAVNAVMNVVDKRIRKHFIRTTSASIKGRGMHELMKYIHKDMVSDPLGTSYCYEGDIRKFYESIDQDIMKQCIRRIFKDKILISLLDGFISMTPKGLSIGLRSSQGLGNLLLSVYLDHYVKEVIGVRYYYRYCDNIVVLSGCKKHLWGVRDKIHDIITSINLEIKPMERVFPTKIGLDFLGNVIRPDYVRLRKRIKKNYARKFKKVKSKERKKQLVGSLYGMSKHADCRRLFSKITGKSMRDFKSMGISYMPEDGKKRFAGSMTSIRELVNLEVIVKDYELGIKTQEGEDRCIVSVEINGEPKKFFTNSTEMKNILEQVSHIKDGFPFKTTIKAELFGKGKTKYVFA